MTTHFVRRALAAAAIASCAATAAADPSIDTATRAEQVAASLAREMAQRCPLAAPSSQPAFEACRQALFGSAMLRERFADIVLWGRQRNVKATLKETNLTQFAPDVLTGMYLPLFMFDGRYSVVRMEGEGLWQIRLRTAFRNRLTPGQFPYPFWHDAEKWAMYQQAREVLLWWDPKTERITVAQFTALSAAPPLFEVDPVPAPAFSGQWMWADERGRTQPAVTVFDGLFKADNPYLGKLDAAYKTLALRLREGQCSECHVPNNPDKMKRLVLLQTPAHAGAEIKRVLKSVRDDRMPRDEAGIEQPLPAATKAALLRDGEAFEMLYEAAKRWDTDARHASGAATPEPIAVR